MNIDSAYNRPLRIISKPGDTTGFQVYLYDAQTEEEITNVKTAVIFLSPTEVNTVQLTFYAKDEQGRIVTGPDHEPITGSVTIESDQHEVDLSVWEI